MLWLPRPRVALTDAMAAEFSCSDHVYSSVKGDIRSGEDFLKEHFTPAPSTVGLRQTGYYCRGDDDTSTTVLGLFSFFSVLILCHLTSLILLPTQRRHSACLCQKLSKHKGEVGRHIEF